MRNERVARVLVITDHAAPTTALLDAIRARAAEGPAQFRLVVPNPAQAELHPLHPERHDKAAEAENFLHESLSAISEAAGGPVLGSVSVRHDPMDAIEDVLFAEPVNEIILDLPEHGLMRRLHQDLEHRLAHYQLPISSLLRG